MTEASDEITFRNPTASDGAAIYDLIAEIGGLERNTCYAYLLLCSHFASGGVVAESGGRLVGFVLGYRPPSRPDAMFVWQVGVHPDMRGRGLATRLLGEFIGLDAYRECSYLEATVGTGNAASRALFSRFAAKRDLPCEIGPGYPSALFASPHHEDEDLFRIGPVDPSGRGRKPRRVETTVDPSKE
jgi:L-2,4-diaminobutyric acid acetyltransferase